MATRGIGFASTPARRFLAERAGAPMRLLRSDTGVVVATVVTMNALRIVSSMTLTRLLAPEAFGAVGVIMSVMFVLVMITDLGFQTFVVRHPDGDEPRFLDAIWTVRLIRAVVLTVAMAVLAGPIAAAMGKHALAALIAVAAVQFLIEGFSSLSLVTALRHGQVARLSLLEIAVAVVQIVGAVALTFVRRDAWAIVAAMVVAAAVKAVLSYAVFPGTRRRWRIDPACNAELWAFARFVTGSSVISMLVMQADKVVLARLFPLDEFGLYVLAGNLAVAPIAFVTAYAARVLYPLYARTWREGPAALAGVVYAARRRVSYLYMAGVGGLIGVAPLLVAILYDHRYADAALYLRLLAVTPLLALGSAAASEALIAAGRVRVTFHASVSKLVWMAVVGPLAFRAAGPVGLVAAFGAVEVPTLAYSWWALGRAGLLNLREESLMLAAAAVGAAGGLLATAALLPFAR